MDRNTPFERVLLTGAAGFVGFHVTEALLDAGVTVLGIDNLTPYYDPALKQARLDRLLPRNGFSFEQIDIADYDAVQAAFASFRPQVVIHLAAQAGVRYSLENPRAYASANLDGFLSILEACRHNPVDHLVYASSSSVYGANAKVPFSEHDGADHPVSLYAATKRADEALSISYAHSHGLAQTGLRFFTVYGPWGRPDMAYFSFTKAIFAGEPLRIFGNGSMRRDFTYIDDIVAGVLAALDRPIAAGEHRVYNLGNNAAASVNDLIAAIETATGRPALRNEVPPPPGEVAATWADIEASRRDLGFQPKTALPEGIRRFVEWYRGYYRV